MPTIYTIGYKKKSLAAFVGQLQQAGVDAVIDVRLRNTSHLAGYSKRDDLAFLLQQGFGVAYEHRPELSPTPEILDDYQAGQDWRAYQTRFIPLLRERQAERVGQEILAHYAAPCLLCAEPTAERCHRRLLAEYWAAHIAPLIIVHL